MSLSKHEKKMISSVVKGATGHRYCKVCGRLVMHMNDQPWEQWEWERTNEMHWGCYQQKQAQKMREA